MGSSNTSLEPARRAEENAFYRTSLALSEPEISGFQFCIRYTLKASIDKTVTTSLQHVADQHLTLYSLYCMIKTRHARCTIVTLEGHSGREKLQRGWPHLMVGRKLRRQGTNLPDATRETIDWQVPCHNIATQWLSSPCEIIGDWLHLTLVQTTRTLKSVPGRPLLPWQRNFGHFKQKISYNSASIADRAEMFAP